MNQRQAHVKTSMTYGGTSSTLLERVLDMYILQILFEIAQQKHEMCPGTWLW